nr:hypothetical protein [Bacteroides acidifaciens]
MFSKFNSKRATFSLSAYHSYFPSMFVNNGFDIKQTYTVSSDVDPVIVGDTVEFTPDVWDRLFGNFYAVV